MLTLYWNRYSTNARKVRFLLAELGTRHDLVEVGTGPERPAWYAELHPYGTIPALADGDLTLYESNAMLRYLALRERRGDLYPDPPAERAVIDQAMDALSLSVRPALWDVELATIYVRVPPHLGGDAGAPADPETLAPALDALHAALDGYESFLAPLGGFSIADCAVAGRFATVTKLPLDLARWPLLATRLESAFSRPAWAASA
jgi:glutathione S-transferase